MDGPLIAGPGWREISLEYARLPERGQLGSGARYSFDLLKPIAGLAIIVRCKGDL